MERKEFSYESGRKTKRKILQIKIWNSQICIVEGDSQGNSERGKNRHIMREAAPVGGLGGYDPWGGGA